MIGSTRTPILFPLAGLKTRSPYSRLGMGPLVGAVSPFPAVRFIISGITKDSSGSVLGSCTVTLFRTIDGLLVDQVISDASTGAYQFSSASASYLYYIVAYLAGSPDVAGTTVNTLTVTSYA